VQARRFRVQRVWVDGVELETGYADVYAVGRDHEPGETAMVEWEAQARSSDLTVLAPGRYALRFETVEDRAFEGAAVLRYSDGVRHLFRGDSRLDGLGAGELG
jgi:hypothetical protein